MRKTIFWHALNCLAHPLSILALLVVGLNDLVLQIYWPSWWTGKLGDAAWMVFSPLLVASMVIWFLPKGWTGQPKRVFLFSLSIVCASFIMVKSVSGFNSAVLKLAKSFGWPLKLILDPTDLIVLPLVLVSWWIWNKDFVVAPRKPRALAILALALFVAVADAAPPPSNCLYLMEDDSIVAKAVHSYYRSNDGGITWVTDEKASEAVSGCGYMVWPIMLDTDPPLTFYYNWDEGLYQTSDQGKTLTRVHVRPGEKTRVDYAIATPFDTLVVASGNGSFAIRLPGGEWLHYEEKYPELLLERVTE